MYANPIHLHRNLLHKPSDIRWALQRRGAFKAVAASTCQSAGVTTFHTPTRSTKIPAGTFHLRKSIQSFFNVALQFQGYLTLLLVGLLPVAAPHIRPFACDRPLPFVEYAFEYVRPGFSPVGDSDRPPKHVTFHAPEEIRTSVVGLPHAANVFATRTLCICVCRHCMHCEKCGGRGED
jgi:hypothetical protein